MPLAQASTIIGTADDSYRPRDTLLTLIAKDPPVAMVTKLSFLNDLKNRP